MPVRHNEDESGPSRVARQESKGPDMKINSIRVEVKGYGVIGNRVADVTVAASQGLDWPDTGKHSVTKGAL